MAVQQNCHASTGRGLSDPCFVWLSFSIIWKNITEEECRSAAYSLSRECRQYRTLRSLAAKLCTVFAIVISPLRPATHKNAQENSPKPPKNVSVQRDGVARPNAAQDAQPSSFCCGQARATNLAAMLGRQGVRNEWKQRWPGGVYSRPFQATEQ